MSWRGNNLLEKQYPKRYFNRNRYFVIAQLDKKKKKEKMRRRVGVENNI